VPKSIGGSLNDKYRIMKKLGRHLFNFSVLITILFLLIRAIISGEGRLGTAVVKYVESPISYTVSIILMVTILLLWVYLIGSEALNSIDKKVKAFGGNYNINTFKAILKNTFKSR